MVIGPRARDADASSWRLPRLRLANMEVVTLLQLLAAPTGGGNLTQPSAAWQGPQARQPIVVACDHFPL